jgi:hypothetical protein
MGREVERISNNNSARYKITISCHIAVECHFGRTSMQEAQYSASSAPECELCVHEKHPKHF